MNKREAAEYLNVSERAVERYTEQGKLSVRYEKGKRGKASVYDESELRRLKATLDGKRSLVRPAMALPDNPDQEARQLARLGDTPARLAQFIGALEALGFHRSARDTRAHVSVEGKLLLKLDEAAALTGLSRATLRAAIEAGKLRAKIVGRAWRIKRADLESYITKL